MPKLSSIQRRVVRFSKVALLGCLGLGAVDVAAAGGGIAFGENGEVTVESGAVAGAKISAYRCETFSEGGMRYLVLKGKVEIGLGGENFKGDEAVVRVEELKKGGRYIKVIIRDANGRVNGLDLQSGGGVNFVAKQLRIAGRVKGAVKMNFSGLTENRVEGLDWVGNVIEALGVEIKVVEVKVGEEKLKATGLKKNESASGGLFGKGTLTFSGGDFSVYDYRDMNDLKKPEFKDILKKNEVVVCLTKPVELIFETKTEEGEIRTILFTAERAVIIGNQKLSSGNSFSSDNIVGIYLEDDVMVTDGSYTIRTPRAYYGVNGGKGLILDAVLNVKHDVLKVPIYVRAAKLRHDSATTWLGEDATVSLSPFAKSHMAVGAKKIKFSQTADSAGKLSHRLKVEGATLGMSGVELIDLPDFDREVELPPLRRFQPGYSSAGGPTLLTRWEMFSLTGEEKVDGVEIFGDLDLRGHRGVGIGAEVNYELDKMFGKMEGYLLVGDSGEDDFSNRDAVSHDGELRGYGFIEHRQILDENWEISVEYGYVSDPIYLERFERELGDRGRAFDASIYMKHVEGQRGFTAEANTDVNGFIAQSSVLQSDGFLVERKPELGMYTIGKTLWDGRLAYFGESRMSHMRIFAGSDSPADRGFSDAQSRKWFGFGAGETAKTSFKHSLEARGLPMGFINRFDTRHEVQAPLKSGVFDVVPYVTARLTAYDEPYGSHDNGVRLWGGAGVRIHTEFSKTWGEVKSPMLGIHGLRHIVEPVVEINYAESSIDRGVVPEFDIDIEGINDGFSGRVGLRQTLETKRGGVGRERVVDLLVMDTDFVFNNRDVDDDVMGRYFGYRPEFSRGGDHFSGEVRWQASDRFGFVGNIVANMDGFRAQQWAAGASMAHTDGLTSFMEYRDLDVVGSRLMTWGLNYRMTKKYKIGVEQVFAFGENDSREFNVTLVRELPGWQMVASVNLDELRGEQSVFLMFYPKGMNSGRANSSLFKPWGE